MMIGKKKEQIIGERLLFIGGKLLYVEMITDMTRITSAFLAEAS